MPHHFTDDEKSKLDECLARMDDFEKRRCDLLRELEEVEAGIIETYGTYGTIYNARNPILTLPPEMTCLIFTFAQLAKPRINEFTGDMDTYVEDGFLMEVVVSHVCRRWRSISLGFPKLWTGFHYEANPNVDVRPLQRFDTYAERSAALPLHIWFNFLPDYGNPDNAQLVEKTIQYAQRWQRFTMYSDGATTAIPFHLLRDLSAPMLEYLTLVPSSIENHPDSDMITSMDPCLFKGGAPKLTYLMLGGHSVCWLPPLSNITILRIEWLWGPPGRFPVIELTPFLEILSLPSLNRLSLSGDIIDPFHATPIHMPNLKSFRVADLNAVWDLLASIRAPQLDTLIIHSLNNNALEIPVLDTGYTFPALNTLHLLYFDYLDPQFFPALIRMTSQVTSVLLHGESTGTILHGGSAGVVWPRLKTLRCNILEEAIHELVTFAKNRPKDLITFRILAPCLSRFDPEGLEALRAISLVVSDPWDAEEPFCPHDIGRFGPNYHPDEDCFRLDQI